LGMDDSSFNQETLTGLRQDLVSLISHSRMYFVNSDDDYIRNTFFMFKEKVEMAIQSFIPEGYPINIIVETIEEPPQPTPALDEIVYDEYDPTVDKNQYLPEIRHERVSSTSSETDMPVQRSSQIVDILPTQASVFSDSPPRTSVNIHTVTSTPVASAPQQESPRKPFKLNLPLPFNKEDNNSQKEEEPPLTAPAELPAPKTPRRNRIVDTAVPPTIEESQEPESIPDLNTEQFTEHTKNGEGDDNNNGHHTDINLSQLLLEVVKNSLGNAWDSLDQEKISKFEQNLKTRVDNYKLQIITNPPELPKRPETSTSQTPPAKQVYASNLVTSTSVTGIASRIKQNPPPPAGKNKSTWLAKEKQTLFKVFDLSSASVSSPRMRLAKKNIGLYLFYDQCIISVYY